MRDTHLAVSAQMNPHRRIVELEHAWERYLSGAGTADTIRPVIADSWGRCQSSGVQPLCTMAPIVLGNRDIEEQWRLHPLYPCVEPVVADLASVVADSGHLVVVSDAQGTLLRLDGEHKTLSRAEEMNFLPGAQWSESAAGTNAIGTALAVGEATQILAAEHYCQRVHLWTCAASVVRDPVTSEVLGVIDLTGLRKDVHPHSLAAVMAAARAVEEQIRKRYRELELLVRSEYMSASNQSQEPMVALSAAGLVLSFPAWVAEQGLLDPTGHLVGLPASVLALTGRTGREWELESPRGKRVTAYVRPIWSDRWLAGYLVQFCATATGRSASQGTVRYSFDDILGCSAALRATLQRARMAAENDLPVLLLGESGTGKEMVAQAIHTGSARRHKPFVAVNCAAIPAELVASELFGYDTGAFTGARRDGHVGKFQQAEGGTLFLDEIGDMPANVQAYLLRVLEEKQVTRLGSVRSAPVNVRIIAATNANLEECIRSGRFRADLFYRLSVWRIALAPLRDRAEDIREILPTYLNQARAKLGRPPLRVHPATWPVLMAYGWPGNARELRNVAFQMAAEVVGPEILPEHLPASFHAPADPVPVDPVPAAPVPAVPALTPGSSCRCRPNLRDTERRLIIETLAACDGSVSEAARVLGVNRSTIYRKIRAE